MRTFLVASATARTANQARNAAFATAPVPSVLSGVVSPATPIEAQEQREVTARRERAAKTTKAASSLHPCVCTNFVATNGDNTGECKAQTARSFAPGHDAKLKAMLVRAQVAGVTVHDAVLGQDRSGVDTAKLFGFGELVADAAGGPPTPPPRPPRKENEHDGQRVQGSPARSGADEGSARRGGVGSR
jgi:hypothetical protein